jgi:predicted nucleic acid-binding protein
VPLVSWKLRRETESILKRVRVETEFDKKFGAFLRKVKTVKINRELPLIMEDPDDNKFLNCALFGKADYLVTSDQHLLKLREYLGIKICKPSQFLKIIGHKKGTKSLRRN